MKFRSFGVFVIHLGLMCLAENLTAHVALDDPQGGETFEPGQVITLQWHEIVQHEGTNWDLYFSSDAGLTWEIIQLDLPHETLNYDWTVPAVATNQGRVRVVQDNIDMDYDHMSGNFTIEEAAMPPDLLTEAEDLSLDCSDDQEMFIQEWLDIHGGATVSSFCSNLVWTHNYTGLVGGCSDGTGTANVIFTASDDCGSVTSMATLIVTDTVPPAYHVGPSDITVDCDGTGNLDELFPWLNSYGNSEISDACSNFFVTTGVGDYDGCGWASTTAFFFITSDECGNTSSHEATFTIEDSSPPLIVTPARDTSFDCSDVLSAEIQEWLSVHGGAYAEDICGNVSWSHDLTDWTEPCTAIKDYEVVFTVSDECGNSATTSAVLTLTPVTGIENPVRPDIARPTVDIYPNPAGDYIQVTVAERNIPEYEVVVINATGENVWSDRSVHDLLTIQVSNLPRGIYFVNVITAHYHYASKVVLN